MINFSGETDGVGIHITYNFVLIEFDDFSGDAMQWVGAIKISRSVARGEMGWQDVARMTNG